LKKKRKHWIDSDGAPGHFKNRFMHKFACEMKEEIKRLSWHGKTVRLVMAKDLGMVCVQ
jgi:hypothetical protein